MGYLCAGEYDARRFNVKGLRLKRSHALVMQCIRAMEGKNTGFEEFGLFIV